MSEIPENKFRIFYDQDAGHYRVIVDDIDLSHRLLVGGVKVDFSVMAGDEFADPEVTLVFPAAGGIDITLEDGQTISEPAHGKRNES